MVRFEDIAAVTKLFDCRLMTLSVPTLEASQNETDEVMGRVDGNDDDDCDGDDISDDDDGDDMRCPSVSSG